MKAKVKKPEPEKKITEPSIKRKTPSEKRMTEKSVSTDKKFRPGRNRRFMLFSLTNRFALFFALMTLIVFTCYISGNFKGFMDSTQLFLLYACGIFSFFAAVLGIAGLVQSFLRIFIQMNPKFILHFVLYLLDLIIIPVIFVIIRTLSLVSLGLG